MAASPATGAVAYAVGPGDVLDIVVFGNDDLSRLATVQTSGEISFPLLGQVRVQGLTTAEIKDLLTRQLSDKYLVNPQLDVQVKEYESQFVSVLGEVNNPGRKPLRGDTRLIDVLIDSGGLSPRASGEIVITRHGAFADGSGTLRVHLGGGSLTAQDQIALETRLASGDIVTVQPKFYVTVEGEVGRPGRYLIEGELTLSGAISLAGGVTRFAGTKVTVVRRPAGSEKVEVVKADLKAIRSGKQPDPALAANDLVTVPRKLF